MKLRTLQRDRAAAVPAVAPSTHGFSSQLQLFPA